MAQPFYGEIRIMAFDYPPRGWAQCNGQLIPTQQNPALFSLLGTAYGGNGTVNFALPDLKGRAIFHCGSGYYWGQRGGFESVPLTADMVGAHNHTFHCTANNANYNLPKNRFFGVASAEVYSTQLNNTTTMNPESINYSGNSTPHDNMQPSLVLNFCIALTGDWPARS